MLPTPARPHSSDAGLGNATPDQERGGRETLRYVSDGLSSIAKSGVPTAGVLMGVARGPRGSVGKCSGSGLRLLLLRVLVPQRELEETIDHRVDLLRHLKLAEMP